MQRTSRPCIRLRTLLLCISITVATLLTASSVSATESLRAVRPLIMKNSFNYMNEQGLMYSEPSLFGLPNYQAKVQAQVKTPSPPNTQDNMYGCTTYAPGFAPANSDGQTASIVALVQRGGNCTFGQKAMQAQLAGAHAIIVYTTKIGTQYPLPKMAGGPDTLNINIPGMLISWSDGQILLQNVQRWIDAVNTGITTSPFYKGVWVELAYELQSPDDHVEWDLFTYPDDKHSTPFIAAFQPVMQTLMERTTFTPRFRVMNGDAHGCELDDSIECTQANWSLFPCGNQCSNCGRYCRLDPNQDPNIPPNGADVVTEITVQRCLYDWSMDNNQPMLWWKYVAARAAANCVSSVTPSQCTATALWTAGVPQAALDYIQTCRGKTGLFDDVENSLLESELDWQDEWIPLTSPYMYVNNFTYYGGFVCGNPPNVATCGPLSIICQGFLAGTAPDICNPNECPNGQTRDQCGVCGGTATRDEECIRAGENGSFPTGAVIGVLFLCCFLIGAAVYFYMRRQNSKMRDDIDSLLKQYLPLDGAGASLNGGSSNKSPSLGHREPNSNLRLIGNLDSTDEPSEL